MCELLVKINSNTHSDTELDSADCYKKYDVVMVVEDGYEWGAGELNPMVFLIIKLPNIPSYKYQFLLNTSYKNNTSILNFEASLLFIDINNRETSILNRYFLDVNNMEILDKERINNKRLLN